MAQARLCSFQVFPARAGVILWSDPIASVSPSIPRASGGDPLVGTQFGLRVPVFPARAGVILCLLNIWLE